AKALRRRVGLSARRIVRLGVVRARTATFADVAEVVPDRVEKRTMEVAQLAVRRRVAARNANARRRRLCVPGGVSSVVVDRAVASLFALSKLRAPLGLVLWIP